MAQFSTGLDMRLPAPFSGRASLRHEPNAILPFLGGSLAVHLPGRVARIAGPDVAVTLKHAHFTVSDGPTA